MKFDVAFSNPPYHINHVKKSVSTSNTRATAEVFDKFQIIGVGLSEITVMIYPATWQKSVEKGLGEYLINNGLKKSYTIQGETIFKGIILPVSVVMVESDYNSEITINGEQISREIETWIDDKGTRVLHDKTKKWKKFLCGVQPSCIISNVETSDLKFSSGKNVDKVSILVKKRQGKQADSDWFFVDKGVFLKTFPEVSDTISKWKVSVRSRLVGRQAIFVEVVFTRGGGRGLETAVFRPHETHGTTWTQIRSFNTEVEAVNFSRYMNTMIAAKLAYLDFTKLGFARFVPDLQDYTNNNPIFQTNAELGEDHEYYGLSLDERLYKLFGLSDDEISVVNGGNGKR